jgi:hypothetical protein
MVAHIILIAAPFSIPILIVINGRSHINRFNRIAPPALGWRVIFPVAIATLLISCSGPAVQSGNKHLSQIEPQPKQKATGNISAPDKGSAVVVSGKMIGEVVSEDTQKHRIEVKPPTFGDKSEIRIPSGRYSIKLDGEGMNKASAFVNLVPLDDNHGKMLRDILIKRKLPKHRVERMGQQFMSLSLSKNPLGSRNVAIPLSRLVHTLLEQPVPGLSSDVLREDIEGVGELTTVLDVRKPLFVDDEQHTLQLERVIIGQRSFDILYAE